MGQKFHADPRTRFVHPNGATAYGPGGPFDCLGRWSKVQACPVEVDGARLPLRLTAYAVGYAGDAFSVPACTRYKGEHLGGFFTMRDDGPVFVLFDRYREKLKTLESMTVSQIKEARKS